MIKKTLYPKTKRVANAEKKVQITEKLDGSNIGFFSLNGELLIAQRNNVFTLSEIDEVSDKLYKGLYEFLKTNGQHLLENLHPNSGFFAEWLGIGKIKYTFNSRISMFAKANIDDELNVYNIYYYMHLLQYPFVDGVIPYYIGLVPLAYHLESYPTVEELDRLYEEYCNNVCCDVEGFVVHQNGVIRKYVRMKNGKLTPHKQ
jgi:hypothetical protein